MNKAPGGQAGKPQANNRSTTRLLTAAICVLGLILLYFYVLTPAPRGKTDTEAPAPRSVERRASSVERWPSTLDPRPSTPPRRETVNRAPIPASPRLTAAPGAGLKVRAGQLLGSDPDGDALSLGNFASRTALGGQVTLAQGWLFYSPPAGATGEDYFGYIVTDDKGAASAGSVSISLTDSSPPAVAAARVLTTEEAVKLSSDGIPGSTYAVEFAEAEALTPETTKDAKWLGLGTAVANAFGSVEYTDRPPAGAGQRVYRFTMAK